MNKQERISELEGKIVAVCHSKKPRAGWTRLRGWRRRSQKQMKVVHYTRDKNFKLRPIKIEEGELPIKPKGGIWASPIDASFGWKDWCELEKFGDISSEYPVILDIDITNFIIIDQESDLDKLPWYKKFGFLEAIDFKKLVNQGVDGIYLTSRGEIETRLSFPRTLYGWDCESFLILNERCICDYWQKELEIRLDEIKRLEEEISEDIYQGRNQG